jgi:hypothetical protein
VSTYDSCMTVDANATSHAHECFTPFNSLTLSRAHERISTIRIVNHTGGRYFCIKFSFYHLRIEKYGKHYVPVNRYALGDIVTIVFT